jgi:eukaryotic-like serine/threonine-protein kinase
VLDFGISKVTNPLTGMSPGARTATSSMMGTPNYVAPEQLQSAKNVDARADIWSIGVILYESLSGQTPFQAETVAQLLVAILQQAPTPLRLAQPNVPPPLERAIMRCLSQDPGARFQNVLELAEAIAPHAPAHTRTSVERIRRALGGAVPSPGTGPSIAPAASAGSVPHTRGQWTRSDTQTRRPASRAAFMASVGAGALVATLLGGAAVMVFRGKPPSRAVEGPAPSLPMVNAAQGPSAPTASAEPEAASDTLPTPSAAPPPTATTAPATTATTGAAAPPRPLRPAPPRPPAGPATNAPPAAPSCHIVTEYDADGQPHFKKVCN